MTKKQALNYLKSSGMSKEQIQAVVEALNSSEIPTSSDDLSSELEKNSKLETVSLGAYKQVAWERDVAIEQLHELGYEFGQKIEPTTKNDLGVDAVSREKAITWAKYFSNIYDAKTANESIMGMLRDLPSVTPQEPKTGHWIEEFVDTEGEVRFTCSCCGKYQLFGTDFCYNCGSYNGGASNGNE